MQIKAFIPEKIPNKLILRFYEFFRILQKHLGRNFDHRPENLKLFDSHISSIKSNKGYIEDQNQYTDMTYGKTTVQAAGCQIIATYNALFNIHKENSVPLSQLIHEYEKDGMIFNGRLGTSPKAAVNLLKRIGYDVTIETDCNNFDKLGPVFHSFILTMFNDATDIFQEMHTINISKNEDGKFWAHNVYCNGKVIGPYDSISDVISHINNGKAKGISLIGISPESPKESQGRTP